MDTSFDGKQSLQVIARMLGQPKQNLQSSAGQYLLWGWAVFLAAAIEWGLLQVNSPAHWWVRPILMPLRAIVDFFLGLKNRGKQAYTTYTDYSLVTVWSGFGLFIFLIILLSATLVGWAHGYLFIIGLIGFGTFTSGRILKLKPLYF